MMQQYRVFTLFDCTPTGIQNHRRSANIDNTEWQFKRNQQRNFETILQCISLRCQPMNIKGPCIFTNENNQTYWDFKFETDKQDIFCKGDNPVGLLEEDCNLVPMIVGLTESEKELFFYPYMITKGKTANTIFTQM
jgi:hypothetical protein